MIKEIIESIKIDKNKIQKILNDAEKSAEKGDCISIKVAFNILRGLMDEILKVDLKMDKNEIKKAIDKVDNKIKSDSCSDYNVSYNILAGVVNKILDENK